MRSRRFESSERFWEVYWEGAVVEVCSGRLGGKGRTSTPDIHRGDAHAYIEAEIAKRLEQGFVEVVPEQIAAQSAPNIALDLDWIARIVEAEDDDTPRLVYADFLQSQGDPRGEFITIQCQRARLPPWDPVHARLVEREEAMLRLHRRRWIPLDVEVEFERGFAARAKLPTRFDQLDVLLDHAPLLRAIEMPTGAGPGWPRILSERAWAQITGFAMHKSQVDVLDLARRLRTSRIERLALRSCGLTAPDQGHLAVRPYRELDVHGNTLGSRGVRHIADNGARLEVLDVGNCGVSEPDIIALAALPAIRDLRVRRSYVTPRAIEQLASLATLRALDLRDNQLGDAAIAAVAAVADRLVTLDLTNVGLTATGVRALASVAWPALRRLDIGGNAIGDADMQTLRDALGAVRIVARKQR